MIHSVSHFRCSKGINVSVCTRNINLMRGEIGILSTQMSTVSQTVSLFYHFYYLFAVENIIWINIASLQHYIHTKKQLFSIGVWGHTG